MPSGRVRQLTAELVDLRPSEAICYVGIDHADGQSHAPTTV
jgi:hypothetical protein